VVCANAHTFFGTPFSTFTGYITRLRGYYRDGRYARTYYWLKAYATQLHDVETTRQRQRKEKVGVGKLMRTPIGGPLWARELDIAHADADDRY
jgi:hypothetical protein